MFSKETLVAILVGLFTSVNALIDWFWNSPLQIRTFSEEELYRYQMFLERPKQALSPPNLVNDWLMVMLAGSALFFLGFISAKLAMGIYQSRFIRIHNNYLKIIVLAGLLLGSCAGYLLLISAYMLPLVWKIYMSLLTAMLTFLSIYMVLRSPYRLYLWWKEKQQTHH